ncbi:MAG TPA: UDP-2,3-diacylglucosamine diphosphatase [Thermoanaerobaculia bacterium]|nr:UDP-2,3-diacylglucosamine diphosphatase [Thermoanaerobaculia bacterium]
MRAVIADSHVGRQAGDEGPFLQALETARRRGATAITLLGDVFHFFIAHRKFETPAIARFLETARALRDAGTPITYVEGNRDFFLRGSYAEGAFREVCDEETFVEGGRRFLATHGDLLNDRDHAYRFWRFLSKNRASRAAVSLVPRQAATRLVWKTEARLHRSNFKHKKELPVAMIRSFAARRFREGVDVLLLGHFHKPWVDESGGKRIEILPAFVEERRWMEIRDDGTTALVSLG